MSAKTKIVMIDDDKNLTNLLSETLETENFEVHAENDPLKALGLINDVQPDIILLDWMMPGKDGIEVLTELKKNDKTQNIPVFMLTSKGMLGEVNRLFTAGADDYISKPFNPSIIAKQIRDKLAKYQKRKSPST